MPELPEVETVVKQLSQSQIMMQNICSMQVFWKNTITFSEDELKRCIVGCCIDRIERRGKYLVFSLTSKYFLIVHLRMSGHFFIEKDNSLLKKHDRVRIHFSNGSILCFHDVRKFGKMYLTEDKEHFFQNLGLEPLSDDFTFAAFQKAIYSCKSIKAILLDQSRIAGLGNIYVDEALFASCIHPLTQASTIGKKELEKLFISIPSVLKKGLKSGGTSLGHGLGNFHSVNGDVGKNIEMLDVYKRDSLPCKRCSSPIMKITVCQRGTHFCPSCQKLKAKSR